MTNLEENQIKVLGFGNTFQTSESDMKGRNIKNYKNKPKNYMKTDTNSEDNYIIPVQKHKLTNKIKKVIFSIVVVLAVLIVLCALFLTKRKKKGTKSTFIFYRKNQNNRS